MTRFFNPANSGRHREDETVNVGHHLLLKISGSILAIWFRDVLVENLPLTT